MPIQSYSNLKDLVTELRGKSKPLVIYHFTNNSKNIEFVKNHTYSGAYVTNDAIVQALNNHLPFGGVGESGYGRLHG
jgi:aldehyde dehydrogenase (NAD+)